jgi:hypothetical protein
MQCKAPSVDIGALWRTFNTLQLGLKPVRVAEKVPQFLRATKLVFLTDFGRYRPT